MMAGSLTCALCVLFASVVDALNISMPRGIMLLGQGEDGRSTAAHLADSRKHYSRRLRNQVYQARSKTGAAGLKYVPGSDGTYSQNFQDKWIAAVARHNGWDNSGGFFLDLGAFNGLKCSNSALIEKTFGWRGICLEARPVPGAFSNRSCLLVTRALSGETGKEVRFYGTPGTQLQHIGKQAIDRSDDDGQIIKTLSAQDLLDCVNSTSSKPGLANEKCQGVPSSMQIPSFINFVSLDIEGQGLNMLKTFPFDKVKIGAWVIEQEDSPDKDKVAAELLAKNGYIQVPVENPGVDKYFIQPQFWDKSLVEKEWRVHPEGSEC